MMKENSQKWVSHVEILINEDKNLEISEKLLGRLFYEDDNVSR